MCKSCVAEKLAISICVISNSRRVSSTQHCPGLLADRWDVNLSSLDPSGEDENGIKSLAATPV
ncbi:hypothetical protein CUMW_013730 [Citrus unshiu]|nr:hypothetical protein CUMW_013730 [Citrus unshiu]